MSVEDSDRGVDAAADRSGTDAFYVTSETGVLIPLASRIEFYDEDSNNPFGSYRKHYPRFTVRMSVLDQNGIRIDDVECKKRILSLSDPIAKRFLPLYTFQSLVRERGGSTEVLYSCKVDTIEMFEFIKRKNLHQRDVGTLNMNRDGGEYRLVTVEKLQRGGVPVAVIDGRGSSKLGQGWLQNNPQ